MCQAVANQLYREQLADVTAAAAGALPHAAAPDVKSDPALHAQLRAAPCAAVVDPQHAGSCGEQPPTPGLAQYSGVIRTYSDDFALEWASSQPCTCQCTSALQNAVHA